MKTLQKRTKILVPSILSEVLGGVPKIKLIPFLSKSRFSGKFYVAEPPDSTPHFPRGNLYEAEY